MCIRDSPIRMRSWPRSKRKSPLRALTPFDIMTASARTRSSLRSTARLSNKTGAVSYTHLIGYFSAKSGNNKIAKQFVPVVLPEESKAEREPEQKPEATK